MAFKLLFQITIWTTYFCVEEIEQKSGRGYEIEILWSSLCRSFAIFVGHASDISSDLNIFYRTWWPTNIIFHRSTSNFCRSLTDVRRLFQGLIQWWLQHTVLFLASRNPTKPHEMFRRMSLVFLYFAASDVCTLHIWHAYRDICIAIITPANVTS